MAELWTREQYLDSLCMNPRTMMVREIGHCPITPVELQAWLDRMELAVVACDGGGRCGHANCHGWRLEPVEFLE